MFGHVTVTGPEVEQGPGGVTTSPTWLATVSSWRGTSRTTKISENLEVFRVILRLPPCDPPQRKCGHENELKFWIFSQQYRIPI